MNTMTQPQAVGLKPRVLVLSSVDLPLGPFDPGRPLPDYMKVIETFQTDILDGRDYIAGRNPLIDLAVRKLGPQIAIAIMALQQLHRYDAVIAMSDDSGLPLAALMKLFRRQTPLYIICQNISSRKPAFYLKRLKAGSAVRRFLSKIGRAHV